MHACCSVSVYGAYIVLMTRYLRCRDRNNSIADVDRVGAHTDTLLSATKDLCTVKGPRRYGDKHLQKSTDGVHIFEASNSGHS
jgi:hypothetical protein